MTAVKINDKIARLEKSKEFFRGNNFLKLNEYDKGWWFMSGFHLVYLLLGLTLCFSGARGAELKKITVGTHVIYRLNNERLSVDIAPWQGGRIISLAKLPGGTNLTAAPPIIGGAGRKRHAMRPYQARTRFCSPGL